MVDELSPLGLVAEKILFVAEPQAFAVDRMSFELVPEARLNSTLESVDHHTVDKSHCLSLSRFQHDRQHLLELVHSYNYCLHDYSSW